ncbi:hypothetical protein GO805_12840 [Staphylococcus aureus]|jgi:hypothetical protein|nr:hypothetical protein [Staphylococcus aureus]HDH6438648.1 hypothetical protein [Staphylococcus aureus MRSA-Lux-28]MVJ15622.1 hypothetical protein [Staphylococcus aureus]HCX2122098.1 hypothetical protein [Staphylococcus aureus]HCX2122772.1 hypothetical protein [Staphylococcus aureus]
MFERANQAVINFIQDAQPLIITLLALSLLAAGLTMMFGDTGRRWAKQTILWSLVGAAIAGGSLVYARAFQKVINVSTIAPFTEFKLAVIPSLQTLFM